MTGKIIFLLISLVASGATWYIHSMLRASGLHERRMRGFSPLCFFTPFWIILSAVLPFADGDNFTVIYILEAIFINFIPYLSCFFVLNFTESKAADSKFIRIFSIVMPAVAIILTVTSPLHDLYIITFTSPPVTGPLFLIHLAMTVVYMFIVYIILFRYVLKNFRSNPLLTVGGSTVVIPVFIYLIYSFFPGLFAFDITAIGYFITIVLVAFASYYVKIKNTKPGLIDEALSNIAKSSELSGSSIEEAARMIAREACITLGAYRVRVWKYDDNLKTIKCAAAYSNSVKDFVDQDDLNMQGVIGFDSFMSNERIVAIDNVPEAAIRSGLPGSYDPEVCAALFAPINIDMKPVGLVCIEQNFCAEYPQKRYWSAQEQSFVSTLSDFMEIAISNAERRKLMQQLEEEIKEYTNLFQLLTQISTSLLQSRPDDFENMLQWCAGSLGNAIGLNRVTVWRNSIKGRRLYCTEIFEWSQDAQALLGSKFSIEKSFEKAVPGWEETLSAGDCISGIVSQMSPPEQAQLMPQGIKSLFVVPIFLHDRFWGFTGFDDCKSEREFSEKEKTILQTASQLIAIVLSRNEEALRTKEAEVLAYHDSLTGIYNRRYLDDNLDRIIRSLSRRKNGVLSLMMVDIDHFKRYNDTYGHDEGDKCLKIAADVLSECITRIDDFVVRYGGEEFAVILPNTDENGARLIAENMLEAIRSRRIPHKTNDIVSYVTFSIGITTGTVRHPQKAGDYIRRADEMLYRSKQEGRNRYTFAAL